MKKKQFAILVVFLLFLVSIFQMPAVVFAADSSSFNEAALIQMAGRAGRNFHNPYGDVLFLCREKSSLCHQCRKQIIDDNAYLYSGGALR